MGELINAEEKFNRKVDKEKDVKNDIEEILKLSPHYDGMPEVEKKELIDRIIDYIEKKEFKKAA